MSAWVRGRKSGSVPTEVYRALWRCRRQKHVAEKVLAIRARTDEDEIDYHKDQLDRLPAGVTMKGRKTSPFGTGYDHGWADAKRLAEGRKHEIRDVYRRAGKARKDSETGAYAPFYDGWRRGLEDRLEQRIDAGVTARRRRIQGLLARLRH